MINTELPNSHRVELTPTVAIQRVRGFLSWQLEIRIGYENRMLRGEATLPPYFIVKEKCRLALQDFDLQALSRKAFAYAYAEQQRFPEERQPFVQVIQTEKVEWDSPSTARCLKGDRVNTVS